MNNAVIGEVGGLDGMERNWREKYEQSVDSRHPLPVVYGYEARDVLTLIARVHALEAQAVLDAKVREAAGDLLTVLKFQGNNHRRVVDLVDALSARTEARG